MEFYLFDGDKSGDDHPVIVRTGDVEHEFKVEIGFLELEVVVYVGALKIVGYAHFSQSGRTTSRRSSDHLRHISDPKLTLSRANIYRVATDELIETVPFVVINLDRADVVYARDVPLETAGSVDEAPADEAPADEATTGA